MSNLITEIYDKQAVVDNLNQLGELINSSLKSIVASAPKLQSPIEYLTAVQSISEIEKKNTEVTRAKAKVLSDLDKVYQQADRAIQQSINLEDAEFQAQTKLTSQYKEREKEQKQLLELERTRQQTMQNGTKLLQMEAKSEGELRMQQQQLIKAQQSLRITNAEENALREKLIEKINANKEALKGMSDEVSKQRDNIGNYKSALEGVTSGQINLGQAMEMTRKELEQLELLQASGVQLTDEQKQRYNDLNVAMGQLTNVQDDISARARILADDYRNMTATMEGIKLGVNIMTSLRAVTALLGDENEELAKTMAQIVAVQQTLDTVTQIQNQLNKDGIIQTNLRMLAERDLTNATIAQTAATKTSIVAMKALQALQTAGLGIIGVFGTALFGMVKMIKDVGANSARAKEEQERHNKILRDAQDETLLYKEEMQRLAVELANNRDILNEIAEAYTTVGAKANLFQKQSVAQLAFNALLKDYNRYLEEYASLAYKIAQYPGYYREQDADKKRLGELYGFIKGLGGEASVIGDRTTDTEEKMARFQKLMTEIADIVEKVNAKSKELAEATKKQTETTEKQTQATEKQTQATRTQTQANKEHKVSLEELQRQAEEWAQRELKDVNKNLTEQMDATMALADAKKKLYEEAVNSIEIEEEEAVVVETLTERTERLAKEQEDALKERTESIRAAKENLAEAFSSITELQLDNLERESDAYDENYERRRQAIENTVMSEEEKERRLKALDNEKTAHDKKVATERAKIERRQAIFNNALASAEAMAKAVASVGELLATSAGGDPYTVIARYIAAVAAGVTAVTTITSLITQLVKIPAFEKGGTAPANQPFIAGEKGREIGFGVYSGKIYDFSKPTLFKSNEPINIKNATETKQIFNNTHEYNKDVTLHNEVVVQVIDNKRIEKFFKI